MFLPGIILLFFIGGSAALLFPRRYSFWIALGTSLATFAAGVLSLPAFLAPREGAFAFEFLAPWIPSLGAGLHFGVDGISYPLFLLTLFLGIISCLIPYPVAHLSQNRQRLYWALILWLLGSVVAVFASLDVLLFYVFWEVVLILMFFLIALFGGENRRYASMKFLLYTQFASLVMLLALIGLYFVAGAKTFDIPALASYPFMTLAPQFAMLATIALLVSFFVKIPAVPFHTWLPDAHVEAPTAGSILLAGVLLKMGAYGIIRIPFTIMPETMLAIAYPLGIFAFATILYGAFVSLAQDNLKRMIAYSSVNHMGYVILGIAAANSLGMKGAVYEMVAHGLGAGLLFAVAGYVHDSQHTFSIEKLKGLMKIMPAISWFFVLGVLAAMGLPTFAGFIAEFTIFVGAFAVYGAYTLIPLAAVVVTAGYFLWTAQRSFFGEPIADLTAASPSVPKKKLAVWTPYALLVAALFFFGLWPPFLFDIIEKASIFSFIR